MIGAACGIAGFVALACWAALLFGAAWALLVVAVAFFVLGMALGDVRVPTRGGISDDQGGT